MYTVECDQYILRMSIFSLHLHGAQLRYVNSCYLF
jgi:hypothetical protein